MPSVSFLKDRTKHLSQSKEILTYNCESFSKNYLK